MQDCRQHGGVMAKCSVCGRYFKPGKSRSICDRDYWRIRRLREKTPEELVQLKRETEAVKACIDLALHASDDNCATVAPLQPRSRYIEK